jgi:hypothetical protein
MPESSRATVGLANPERFPLIGRVAAWDTIRSWQKDHEVDGWLRWSRPFRSDGYVYFARNGDGVIKVGWSADPIRRIRGLAGKYEFVVAIVGCPYSDEDSLHRFLCWTIAKPVRGREWYAARSLVTSLAFRLRTEATASLLDVRAPKRAERQPAAEQQATKGAA